jgi:hypothetical protein
MGPEKERPLIWLFPLLLHIIPSFQHSIIPWGEELKLQKVL